MKYFNARAQKLAQAVLLTAIIGGALNALNTTSTKADIQKPKSLIELFTSQGCNSCPPANALLKKYIARDDVIAISLPVDYWDYLGWPDTFGKAQFSKRQRHYALNRRDGQVYTPQIVANGVTHAVGSRPNAINDAIRKSYPTISRKQIPINLKLEGNKLTVYPVKTIPSPAHISDTKIKTTVWLALTNKKVTIPVPRGENRGKTITYYNVVRELKSVGNWNGKPVTISLPENHGMADKSDGCVVFLQVGNAGPIIAAAEL